MEKLHQSPMIGEVLAGILVGPMVLGLINPDPTTSFGESLNVVANLGVFILVLLAGIELGREGLRKAFKERSMVVANRKSTRLNSSHLVISYAVFCLKKKK